MSDVSKTVAKLREIIQREGLSPEERVREIAATLGVRDGRDAFLALIVMLDVYWDEYNGVPERVEAYTDRAVAKIDASVGREVLKLQKAMRGIWAPVLSTLLAAAVFASAACGCYMYGRGRADCAKEMAQMAQREISIPAPSLGTR